MYSRTARSTARSKADEQFAAAQKKARRVATEKEKAAIERAERTARLKALRLAKEAAEREDAKKATTPEATEKVAADGGE